MSLGELDELTDPLLWERQERWLLGAKDLQGNSAPTRLGPTFASLHCWSSGQGLSRRLVANEDPLAIRPG